jgi:hypothetical protein
MGMLVCKIVYLMVLNSNDFGTVSGRKEGINTERTEIKKHRGHRGIIAKQ